MKEKITPNLSIGNTNLELLHTNQRLLVEVLLAYGAKINMLDEYEELLEICFDGEKDFLIDRFSSKVPYHVVKMSADKFFAKQTFIKANISVPDGQVFVAKKITEALSFSKTLYPVVLKPNWGSHGDGVHVNIENENELTVAIENFSSQNGFHEPFLIEKYYPWNEFRIFITKNKKFAVVNRQPAFVIGNGFHDIKNLIIQENEKRYALKKTQFTCICPISLDNQVFMYLNKNNLNLEYVPNFDEKVLLRLESNLAKGGIAVDVTNKIDHSYIDIAFKALQAFPGLPVAGLDVLIEDITKQAQTNNYKIIEINSSPGLAMHTYPNTGNTQNVAKMLAEVMFPNIIK